MEVAFWQFSAGLIAFLFVFIAAAALVRYPRPVMAVLLVVVLGLPTAGLVAYAADPVPLPDPGAALWLAFIPAIAGLAGGVWMLAFMTRRRASLTVAEVERLSNGTLVAMGGMTLAVSALAGLWQPAFGIANVALNAAWAAIWIPPAVRRNEIEASVDLAAPRARVYSFMADTSNWPRYQEDVEGVAVDPPGPLTPGCRVTVTQRHESKIRGPRLLPGAMAVTSIVDAVEPDSRIATRLDGRPESRGEVLFADAGGGTRVTTRAVATAPYRLAVFGALVELWAQKGAREARARRNLDRLKHLLETPANGS